MKVSEAVAQLLKLPQDLELMDDYCENRIDAFSVSTYDDDEGMKEYVVYEQSEAE